MKSLTVAVESVAQMWDDMQALLVEHWNEIAHNKEDIPLAPDRSRYESMEANGRLLAIACREDGKIIGYSVFCVLYHMHYMTSLVGVNDVLFVSKEFRKTRAGLMLKRESEKRLKELGAVQIVWRIKPENDWSKILTHDGYEVLETAFSKLL